LHQLSPDKPTTLLFLGGVTALNAPSAIRTQGHSYLWSGLKSNGSVNKELVELWELTTTAIAQRRKSHDQENG